MKDGKFEVGDFVQYKINHSGVGELTHWGIVESVDEIGLCTLKTYGISYNPVEYFVGKDHRYEWELAISLNSNVYQNLLELIEREEEK